MSKKLIGILSVIGIAALIASTSAGVYMSSKPASAQDTETASKAESADSGSSSGKTKTYKNVDFRRFVIALNVREGGQGYSYAQIQMKVRLKPNTEGLSGKKPVMRDAIITHLYDLDGEFNLDNKEDVERVRSSVRNAVNEAFGSEVVDKVLFQDLVPARA